MNPAEAGMFMYPWAVGDFAAFTEKYSTLGLNGIAPAFQYHRGTFLQADNGRVYRLPESALSFRPNAALYGESGLVPAVNEAAAKSDVTARIAEWAKKSGIAVNAWTVLLHNSSIGGKNRELTVENAFGDRYEHALCSANERVRNYSDALITDICANSAPENILVESATFIPAFHGGHHEISNVIVSPALHFLYSLCFCPRCMEKANAAGADAEKARYSVKSLAVKLLNSEPYCGENGEGWIAAVFLEKPEIFLYEKARQANTAAYIEFLGNVIHRNKARFRLMPNQPPLPDNSAYNEGMSYAEVGRLSAVDEYLPLIYSGGENYRNVRAALRLFDEKTPMGGAFTLHPGRYPDKGSFIGAVAAAAEDGCRTAYFYNYSIASEERLGWIREAAQLLRE
ncbi:hypothetical protein FACS189499_07150 [Clostridia bacterium]|nr:hypothetical protein FACS189499_07150 [Clostridia bacterium]